MIAPMLASLADAPLDDPDLVYEPKYDGIRAIVEIAPRGVVRLWSRLGNEKTRQFPEITAALKQWARGRTQPLVLDGEIVALDAKGAPAGFQQLQGRIHIGGRESIADSASARSTGGGVKNLQSTPDPVRTALIAFDLLRDGSKDYRNRPLTERRSALEKMFGRTGSPTLRISEQVRGDGRALYQQAMAQGWEGLIAKDADSVYKPGKRSPEWRKLKLVHEQEFVVGGWTEPRQTRAYFGALLLGVYDGGHLVYAGHTGTGFNEKELGRVMQKLAPLEIPASPFKTKPKTNERPHWVRPELVAQIKFTEWTADGKLRHPVYLGLRDDKKATDVTREQKADVRRSAFDVRRPSKSAPAKASTERTSDKRRTTNDESRTTDDVVAQLQALEQARKDGMLVLPDGDQLKVTNLHKVFWPKQKFTKGDLMRYYARVAPYILPAVADRPLVMKRFPNGVAAAPFYQHRAADVPAGVRTQVVGVVEERPQIIGGSLKALLYMTQLAAISQDPWFSRVAHPECADYAALDLDPLSDVPFSRVLDVARWIRDELDALGAIGVAKTSGGDGLHIYIPLPAGTPYEAGMIYCQIVAALVEKKHPKHATTERSVKARGNRIYIDCLQNIPGKTLATAYSARASDYAGVSTPVTWQEVDEGFERTDFTIETVRSRFDTVGDLWARLRKSKGVDLKKMASLGK
jgi:bifunctional non-homologous end joining protein LigD